MIAFSNDDSVAGDGVYLMGITPRQSIDRVVAFARGRGMNRFGALVPANVYGERAGQAMTQAVEGAGGQLVGIAELRARRTAAAAATGLNRRGRL